EPLVEVETDKVNSELESPVDGVVTEILVAEGETAPVGAVLARISDGTDAPSTAKADKPAAEPDAPRAGGLSTMRRRIPERLQVAEVGGGEFTVTNVGGGGALMAFPLVNPGQPGILAPGAVRDGRCLVTLCYDRRTYDDWAADRLLARVGEELATL